MVTEFIHAAFLVYLVPKSFYHKNRWTNDAMAFTLPGVFELNTCEHEEEDMKHTHIMYVLFEISDKRNILTVSPHSAPSPVRVLFLPNSKRIESRTPIIISA